MARKDHGQSINSLPMLQPGSSFDITESGFDTGTRKFVVDRSALPLVLPIRNSADTAISYTTGGNVTLRGNYSGMYVNSVSSITEMRNNLVEYTVGYRGLVKPKHPHFRSGVSYNVTDDGLEILPTLTHTYVTSVRPDPNGIGRTGTGAFFELVALTPTRPPSIGGTIVERGWILANREISACGPLFEVMDKYNYIIRRAEA